MGWFPNVIGSILLIAVGNCLENVFRGSVMSRVLSGTLLLASIMVVFEISYASGLSLQLRDFVNKWASSGYYAYLMSTYFMMDHASDLIWTLDNVLYTYFMLILGFLTSEHDVILHYLD
ncbi:hypothetical protein JH06_5811 [Blastocystis sp. subtype 4]|uniref:hypothetical protein n=1 Tax=Blastocystis sp. subtype 4 TaxID=944170 RepID=UPI000711A0AD|nr:hypothetical protein JH06_5811 [Blastocystis sp. subtype 4]KNB41797.1 hypothetical protein JH06_5811 [Blastocystis sp. subtype 4]|eukprot:XP_014525240.1 hypothetical protein JH06_5811 [Blastocystis sp. subtype 4]